MARPGAPVLVQRELLLNDQQPDSEQLELLVAFQRQGRRVLLVAEQPVGWRPTRKAVDHDLALQQQLHQLIRRAGAELDGVVYLATGFFARKRNRVSELEQLARRYATTAGELIVIARDAILLETMVLSGGRALAVGDLRVSGATTYPGLRQAFDALS
ncbi:MAG: hypothetical protein JJU31_08075 [Wenzhouxiangella sp.]|nr:hypothetical protein [Wenzhouxiangella sp.]MCH8476734.1 hypothetical protein [Wenzhouxiangella sp.]TVR92840.1 MAG: hypothetical protein EA418_12790 [Wenzhouxiangellaceae bacterium]